MSPVIRYFLSARVECTAVVENTLGSISSIILRAIGPGYRVEISEYFTGGRHILVLPTGWRRFVPAFFRSVGRLRRIILLDLECLVPEARVWTVVVR